MKHNQKHKQKYKIREFKQTNTYKNVLVKEIHKTNAEV